MQKFFQTVSREKKFQVNEQLFQKEEVERKKRISTHIEKKYGNQNQQEDDEIEILPNIETNKNNNNNSYVDLTDDIDDAENKKDISPYFKKTPAPITISPTPETPQKASRFLKNVEILSKRKSPDKQNEEPGGWISNKRFKSSQEREVKVIRSPESTVQEVQTSPPSENKIESNSRTNKAGDSTAKSQTPQPPKSVDKISKFTRDSFAPSNSMGSISRANKGINGFREQKRRTKFSEQLYKKGSTLITLTNATHWADQPTKRTNTAATEETKLFLNEEQRNLLEIALSGKSIFFTGSAGTGKSFVLRVIVEELQIKHGYNSVYVTASTGIAACNIQGVTVHAFSGLGLANGTKEELYSKISVKKHFISRWQKAMVLIVDEISMISADFFTKLEYVARKIRKSEKPFGGVQVILCGDFFQLPPVSKNDKTTQFCFESEVWNKVVEANIELKQVIRQKNPEFVKILNEIRLGKLSPEGKKKLEERIKAPICAENDGIKPTKLYPHRADVSDENRNSLAQEEGEMMSFHAQDTGSEHYVCQLDQYCQAPKELCLKKGCQVMLLKNIEFKNCLVNGSRGYVVGFTNDPEDYNFNTEFDPSKPKYPVVRFSNTTRVIMPDIWQIEIAGQVQATRSQIPLSLAYALSIHKSQGMSIERLEISLSRVFTYGQAYVALSRATSLEGLRLSEFSSDVIKAHPKVLHFYSCFKETKFELPDALPEPTLWSDDEESLPAPDKKKPPSRSNSDIMIIDPAPRTTPLPPPKPIINRYTSGKPSDIQKVPSPESHKPPPPTLPRPAQIPNSPSTKIQLSNYQYRPSPKTTSPTPSPSSPVRIPTPSSTKQELPEAAPPVSPKKVNSPSSFDKLSSFRYSAKSPSPASTPTQTPTPPPLTISIEDSPPFIPRKKTTSTPVEIVVGSPVKETPDPTPVPLPKFKPTMNPPPSKHKQEEETKFTKDKLPMAKKEQSPQQVVQVNESKAVKSVVKCAASPSQPQTKSKFKMVEDFELVSMEQLPMAPHNPN